MTVRLGVLMDPLASVNVDKDSTLAMLREAQSRHWTIECFGQQDLCLRNNRVSASSSRLTLHLDAEPWYSLSPPRELALGELDVLLMRKDPPFDMEYVYTTYLLERVEMEGVLVVNRPRSLRDANEKLFTAWFPQCCSETMVTRDSARIRDFLTEHAAIVVKPLDGMGGASVFKLGRADPNLGVILETITHHGSRFAMAQRYIPEISESGDKRILIIDGQPIPYALARIPAAGESRGNLAAGAKGVGVELSARDRWICEQVGDELRERGLIFVGLDVIGDYLTEINVTSPTCIQELDGFFGLNIAATLLQAIEQRL
jgi:glutathione synthase